MRDAAEQLTQRFKDSRDETFLIDADGTSLTYGEVWSRACSLSAAWKSQGLSKGDAVALLLPNGPTFVCCYIACLVGGYVAAPINRDLSEEDIDYILSITQPTLVLREEPEIPDALDSPVQERVDVDSDSVCAIFFTSGTTGRPKGVRHSLKALAGNVSAFNRMMGMGPHTRMYHVLPMGYMAGFLNTLLSPLMAGGSVVLGPRFSPRSALDFWTAAYEQEAQTLWVTPSIAVALQRMARDPERARRNAAGFSRIFCGTAPLADAVRTSFLETFGVPLQESYGTSELLLISGQAREEAAERSDVGTVLPELDVELRSDAEGNPELMVKSPFAYLGYLTDRGVIDVETSSGFIPTGDAGELRDGRLVITGRLKDLIIRGGVNIAPIVLENEIRNVPGVSDVAIVGLPHRFWGESIAACIEAEGSVESGDLIDKVRRHCREHLARSYQPDAIEIFESLPRAVTGKIQKNVLQAKLAV